MPRLDASWFSARYALAAARRARLGGNRSWRWPDLAIADGGSPLPSFNQATLLATLGPSLDRLDQRLASAFSESAASDFRLFSAWPTRDLTRIGLADPRPSVCMVREVGGPEPHLPPELTIQPVTTAADLDRFEAVLDASFRNQARSGAIFPAHVLADRSIRLWLGIVDGEPVGCSAAYLVSGAVGVDHVGTRPEARGRGYGTALAWQATQADATRPAFLEASELGRPIYERLGYRLIHEAVAWSGPTRRRRDLQAANRDPTP